MVGVQPTTVQYASPVWGLAVVKSSISIGSRHLPVPPQDPLSQGDTKRCHDWSDGGFQFSQTVVLHKSRSFSGRRRSLWVKRVGLVLLNFTMSSFAKVNPLNVRLTLISPKKVKEIVCISTTPFHANNTTTTNKFHLSTDSSTGSLQTSL